MSSTGGDGIAPVTLEVTRSGDGALPESEYLTSCPAESCGAKASPDMAARDNQRRDARVEANIPVVVHRGRTKVRLVTVDVSYRGLFVETSDTKASAIRSLVKLHVELPTGGFDAHAMIVHLEQGEPQTGGGRRLGMGLQFWALTGTERKIWETFVRSVIEARRATMKVAATPVGPDSQVSGIRSVAPVASAPSEGEIEIEVAPKATAQRATRR